MVWDNRKNRLQKLIQADTGIVRKRQPALERFAQKRAREIKAELDPYSQNLPTHRGWLPGMPVTEDTWKSYWEDLPDWVTSFGENLTWNYLHQDTILAAAKGWRNSPVHWANESNPTYKNMGLGITRVVLEGDENFPLAWRWFYVAIYTN